MIPHISDKGRRVLRTVLQVLAAFLTFAAAYPLIVQAIGAPTGSRLLEWLLTVGTWISAAAAIITRVMAIPAVDQVLTLLGVGSIPRSQVQVSLKQLDAVADPVLDVLAEQVPVTAPAIEKLEDIEAALAPDPAPAPAVPAVARATAAVDPTATPGA